METAEHRVVDPKCLPFSSIPHTSRLFDDFLHHFDKVRGFYARPPLAGNWWEEEKKRIVYPDDRRKVVADILQRQNQEFGAGAKTLQNIERLRDGAPAVVTGQQVGLFGGPLFCVFKAISASKLAEQTGAVPVFCLAIAHQHLAAIDFLNRPSVHPLQRLSSTPPHTEAPPARIH